MRNMRPTGSVSRTPPGRGRAALLAALLAALPVALPVRPAPARAEAPPAPAGAIGARIGSAGHYLTGNSRVKLLNPDGRDFTVTVHRYNWPFEGSWNKRALRLAVSRPDGTRVRQVTLRTDEAGASVRVPGEGRAGTYTVKVNAANTLNYWHLSTSLPRAVVVAGPGQGQAYRGEGWFFGAPMVPRTWSFWVPEGTDKFTLRAQSGPARSQREDHGLIIRSPRGQPMAALWDQANPAVIDGRIVAGRKTLRHQTAHVVVEPGSDGRFWSLEVRLGGAHTYSDVNFALEGVPHYVAHSPETWFNPDTSAVVRPAIYDDDPFVRSDVPPDEQRERPYFDYWMPVPALGDPDGNEIRTPAQIAMWNPAGRKLKWVLRSYIIRGQEAIRRGEREPERASITLRDEAGRTRRTESIPMHPSRHEARRLDFEGVRFIDVDGAEHFWTYTYPAVPTVLVGEAVEGGWRRFRLEVGSLRHWYFRVPEGTSDFRVRAKARYERDVVAIDVLAPDRRVARLYGHEASARIQVPPGTGGRIWHLRVDVGDATEYVPPRGTARFATVPFDLDLSGVPGYLAPTWAQWFDPRAADPRPDLRRPEP